MTQTQNHSTLRHLVPTQNGRTSTWITWLSQHALSSVTGIALAFLILTPTFTLAASTGTGNAKWDLRTIFPFSLLADNNGNAISPFPINLVISPECVEELVFKLNVFNVKCLKEVVANGLSYAIVVLSGILKLPIIVNMVKQRSGVGLELTADLLETTALLAHVAACISKDLPFKIWGEVLIISVQNFIIRFLVEHYSYTNMQRRLAIFGFLGLFTVVALCVPRPYADALVAYATLCAMLSRAQIILANFQRGHTGVLSIITQSLIISGASVRLATILYATNDVATIVSTCVSLALNLVVTFQVLWYWDATKQAFAADKIKKKD